MLRSDSGHWYDREGTPCYTQITASGKNKGKERNTTLRDARKFGLLPSTTGIIKVADKPALNRWIQQQLLETAVTLPRLPNETAAGFYTRIKDKQAKEGACRMQLGTDIHDALEQGFHNLPIPKEKEVYYHKVINCLHENLPGEKWVSEDSFGSELGYGGKVDLHSPNWVIDFKTKEFTPDSDPAKFVYDDHLMQLLSYGHGLKLEDGFNTGNIFISTHPDHVGYCAFVAHDPEHYERAWSMFKHLLGYWKLLNNYNSGWE